MTCHTNASRQRRAIISAGRMLMHCTRTKRSAHSMANPGSATSRSDMPGNMVTASQSTALMFAIMISIWSPNASASLCPMERRTAPQLMASAHLASQTSKSSTNKTERPNLQHSLTENLKNVGYFTGPMSERASRLYQTNKKTRCCYLFEAINII